MIRSPSPSRASVVSPPSCVGRAARRTASPSRRCGRPGPPAPSRRARSDSGTCTPRSATSARVPSGWPSCSAVERDPDVVVAAGQRLGEEREAGDVDLRACPGRPPLRRELLGDPALGDADGRPGRRARPARATSSRTTQGLHARPVTARSAGPGRPGAQAASGSDRLDDRQRPRRVAASAGRPARRRVGLHDDVARRERHQRRPRRRAPRRRRAAAGAPAGPRAPGRGRPPPRRRRTASTRPSRPRGTPGASCGRGSTRSTRCPTTSAAPTASSATSARPEPVEPAERAAARRARPTAQQQQHRRRTARRRGRAGAGGTSAAGRRRGSPGRRRPAGRPAPAARAARGRRSAATAAAAPTASDPAKPWMPVASTQASTRPELQHQHRGQPARRRPGARAGATSSADREPRRGRRRAGGAPAPAARTPGAGGLTGRSSQKCGGRSARRAERPTMPASPRRRRRPRSPGVPADTVAGHVGYPALSPRQRRRRSIGDDGRRRPREETTCDSCS